MQKNLIDIIAALFVFLFVYAAISKLLEYEKFIGQIGQSPMLTNLAAFIAWFIPAVELLIASLLLFAKTRLVGLYFFFGLMVAFTSYIVLASRFSDYVPCSCGGVIGILNWTQHLIFNLVFVSGAVLAIVFYPLSTNSTINAADKQS